MLEEGVVAGSMLLVRAAMLHRRQGQGKLSNEQPCKAPVSRHEEARAVSAGA